MFQKPTSPLTPALVYFRTESILPLQRREFVDMPGVPISDSASVVASRDLLSSELAGELVVLDLSSGEYYSLDEVGIRVWQLLQEPATVSAIRDAVVSEYDVDPVRCEHDIRALLGEMAARGLVEIREDS